MLPPSLKFILILLNRLLLLQKNIRPTKLYEIMGILREYDMKSKGMEVSGLVDTGDLQKEMIYKILH